MRDAKLVNSGEMPQNKIMNKNKLKKMEKEFPFLKSLLDENFGAFLKNKNTNLNVNIQRMDPTLLFYAGDHLDGMQSRYIGEKKYGSLFASFFFLDESGKIILRHYGLCKPLLLGKIIEMDFMSRTKFIIKTKVETWYEEEFDENGHLVKCFKHFSHRDIKITIYKEPKNGSIESFLRDPNMIYKVHLTNKLIMELCYVGKQFFDQIDAEKDILISLFKPFFEKHLQAAMYPERAFNSQIGNIKFLSLSMAGRLLITLDTPNAQISYIALDEETGDSHMGIQSIDGTLVEVKKITETFITECKNRFEKGEKFTDIFHTGKVGFVGQTFGQTFGK